MEITHFTFLFLDVVGAGVFTSIYNSDQYSANGDWFEMPSPYSLQIIKVTEEHDVLAFTLKAERGILKDRRNILIVPLCSRIEQCAFTITSTKKDDQETWFLDITKSGDHLRSGEFIRVYDYEEARMTKRDITDTYEIHFEDIINHYSSS